MLSSCRRCEAVRKQLGQNWPGSIFIHRRAALADERRIVFTFATVAKNAGHSRGGTEQAGVMEILPKILSWTGLGHSHICEVFGAYLVPIFTHIITILEQCLSSLPLCIDGVLQVLTSTNLIGLVGFVPFYTVNNRYLHLPCPASFFKGAQPVSAHYKENLKLHLRGSQTRTKIGITLMIRI